MNATDLSSRFPIAGVFFTDTPGGLVKATMSYLGMTGELYLQGAHVTAWQPPGHQPVIYTSPNAVFAPGKAIRGGVPVIFPWFGAHPSDPAAGQHGFARTADWQLDSVERVGETLNLALTLAAEEFTMTYRVGFGAALGLSLTVHNIATQDIDFEEALHTYFAIGDVERVTVSGLEGASFIDKTVDMKRRCPPAGAALSLTGETDRVYLDTPDTLVVNDPDWRRRITIAKSNAASAIVWNPWPEKAAAMSDLGADNWRGMICVETGNVGENCQRLPAGATHEMTTLITVDAD